MRDSPKIGCWGGTPNTQFSDYFINQCVSPNRIQHSAVSFLEIIKFMQDLAIHLEQQRFTKIANNS